jgi:hypothetical protein
MRPKKVKYLLRLCRSRIGKKLPYFFVTMKYCPWSRTHLAILVALLFWLHPSSEVRLSPSTVPPFSPRQSLRWPRYLCRVAVCLRTEVCTPQDCVQYPGGLHSPLPVCPLGLGETSRPTASTSGGLLGPNLLSCVLLPVRLVTHLSPLSVCKTLPLLFRWGWRGQDIAGELLRHSTLSSSDHANSVECGVPQGSRLAPLLISIFTNGLPLTLNKTSVSVYADDSTVHSTH